MLHWDTGSIPSLAQWIKKPVLPQLQLRSSWLGYDPWPRRYMYRGEAKKGRRKKKKKRKKRSLELAAPPSILWGEERDTGLS